MPTPASIQQVSSCQLQVIVLGLLTDPKSLKTEFTQQHDLRPQTHVQQGTTEIERLEHASHIAIPHVACRNQMQRVKIQRVHCFHDT
jgi:hypothetical protein